jgi:hypothetical protein
MSNNRSNPSRLLSTTGLLCRWVRPKRRHYGFNVFNQFVLAACVQVATLEAVELPQNLPHVGPVWEENSALISDVSSDISVVSNGVSFPLEMAPPSGQLTPEVIESRKSFAFGSKYMGDQNSSQTAAEEGESNRDPISSRGGAWHDVKYVLGQIAIVLMCWTSMALGGWVGFLIAESALNGWIASFLRHNIVYPHLIVDESDSPTVFSGFSGMA